LLQVCVLASLHIRFFPLALNSLRLNLTQDTVRRLANDVRRLVQSLFTALLLSGLLLIGPRDSFLFFRGATHIVALGSFGQSFFERFHIADETGQVGTSQLKLDIES
jgi:hypothetical protein